MNALLSSLSRVRLIAVNTAGEAVRQRYFLVSGLLAAAVVALSSGLGAMDFGASELKFIADLGFGALFFFGSLLAVVLPVHLFFSEMENRTALTLLARPLRRWEFLAGKLLGHLLHDAAGRGHVLVHPQALLGEGEHALAPLDQAHAQVLFQALERVAHARLAERQAPRGAGDAAFLDDDEEGVQQVPVQIAQQALARRQHDRRFSQAGRHGGGSWQTLALPQA